MNLEEADSLSEQIAKYISEQIISGELVEGERIQELRIAKELDVSRGSVREALLLLERTYLIEIFPRRGAIVSEMSAQQVKALFDTNVMVLGHIVHQIRIRHHIMLFSQVFKDRIVKFFDIARANKLDQLIQ